MLPIFAIFEFETDKSMAIGRTEWIPDIYEAGINTVKEFDFEASCEVMWPENASAILKSKSGKVPDKKGTKSYEVMVLAFGDSIECLQKKLVELEKSDSTATTSGRSTTKPKRFLYDSDEDVEAGTDVKEVKTKEMRKLESEKKSEAKISAIISSRLERFKRARTKSPDRTENYPNSFSAKTCQDIQVLKDTMTEMSRKVANIEIIVQSILDEKSSRLSTSASDQSFLSSTPVRPRIGQNDSSSIAENPKREITEMTSDGKLVINTEISSLLSKRPEKMVCELMSAVWTRQYMSTHSLTGLKTGKASDDFKERVNLDELDAIRRHVAAAFPQFPEKDFRSTVRSKLNNEEKMAKKNMKLDTYE